MDTVWILEEAIDESGEYQAYAGCYANKQDAMDKAIKSIKEAYDGDEIDEIKVVQTSPRQTMISDGNSYKFWITETEVK